MSAIVALIDMLLCECEDAAEMRENAAELLCSRLVINCLIGETKAVYGQHVKCKHCTNHNI